MPSSKVMDLDGVLHALDHYESLDSHRKLGTFEREAVRENDPSVEKVAQMLDASVAAMSQDAVGRIFRLLGKRGGSEDVPTICSFLLRKLTPDSFPNAAIIALQKIAGPRSLAALDTLSGIYRDDERISRSIEMTMRIILESGSPNLTFGDHVNNLAGPGTQQVHFGQAAHFGSDTSSDIARDSAYFVDTKTIEEFQELQNKFSKVFAE